MEKMKSYFTGKWYRKKSAIITFIALAVILAACICMVFAFNSCKPANPVQSSSEQTDIIKEHYGVYNESTSLNYACRDINGNLLQGYRSVVKAQMKAPMTKEELLNDAIYIDKQTGAVETEIHFIYKLDPSYNMVVYVCKGEFVDVSIEGRKFITREELLQKNSGEESA